MYCHEIIWYGFIALAVAGIAAGIGIAISAKTNKRILMTCFGTVIYLIVLYFLMIIAGLSFPDGAICF